MSNVSPKSSKSVSTRTVKRRPHETARPIAGDSGDPWEISFIDLLNRWFRREEINGAERCPTYLYRWQLFRCRWFTLYLHRFVGEDWSRDMHDHPKRFLSVGLAGAYEEQTPAGTRIFRAPWIRSFPAEHVHRIKPIGGECWTLVAVFAASRPWGFFHDGLWIHWKKYVEGFGGIADQMKSCPDE
jgi:hypothetical protein